MKKLSIHFASYLYIVIDTSLTIQSKDKKAILLIYSIYYAREINCSVTEN